MRLRVTAAIAFACAVAGLVVALSGTPAKGARIQAPSGFYGIVPQSPLTEEDTRYMKAGGIESVRLPLGWSSVQPTRKGGYDWTSFDAEVATAARAGLRVLPFIASTPRWVTRKSTTLPIDGGQARRGWAAFVKAAVKRYGPGGEFWAEHAPTVAGINYVPAIPRPVPIRVWQIWNEANFFYSTYPASPSRYARLLKLTAPAIRSADPGAKIVTAGLFGDPDEGGKLAMDATKFLEGVYRVPGIKASFDAIALHPYAFHVNILEELTDAIREVALRNHDPGVGLYITELGWGSQNDPNMVAFEQGIQGQARELRGAYRYFLTNRHRLNLKGAYWFSWKDLAGYCNFCDSVGLFRQSERFHPKPAWHAFVSLTGGRARP
jgi:Beta-galactosidase